VTGQGKGEGRVSFAIPPVPPVDLGWRCARPKQRPGAAGRGARPGLEMVRHGSFSYVSRVGTSQRR
jgi:hypothetical protein